MSSNVMPILFYNLGGEMMYVIEQRLRAQHIDSKKSSKVLSDIVCTMFNSEFVDDIMKPQALYNKQAMRLMFSRLVHSSIMKVNKESMDKLYDLMVMALKYQVTQCMHPRSILCVTFNHFDCILDFISEHSEATTKVKDVFNKFVATYASLTDGEFILIRQSLLSFLQDTNNKVSIYLQENVQNNEGKFVINTQGEIPYGSDVPGTIRLFKGETEETASFKISVKYKPSHQIFHISYSPGGVRTTKLGCNIYSGKSACLVGNETKGFDLDGHLMAKAELGLLAKLIGSEEKTQKIEFRLQLFNAEKSPPNVRLSQPFQPQPKGNVLEIKASPTGKDELSKIVSGLTVSSSSQSTSRGEDLLSLMDL